MRLTPSAVCALAVAVTLVLVACVLGCAPKETPSESAAPTPPAPKPAPSTPADDAPTDEPTTADEPTADEPTTEAATAEVTLTAEVLDKWIASVADPRVQEIMATLKPEGKVSFTEQAATADKAGENEELDAIAKEMGYADGAEWAAVTKRVFAGLLPMAITMAQEQMKAKGNPDQLDDMMEQTNAQLDEIKAAFGELSDGEAKLIQDKAADIGAAMAPKPE